jgi:hypothetical protein
MSRREAHGVRLPVREIKRWREQEHDAGGHRNWKIFSVLMDFVLLVRRRERDSPSGLGRRDSVVRAVLSAVGTDELPTS